MPNPFFISNQPDALLHFLPMNTPLRGEWMGPVFILTTAGRATVEVDGRPYLLSPGTLLSLLPSHLHHTVTYENDFRCLTLAFQFDAMADFPYMLQSPIAEKIGHTPFILLSAEEQERLEDWHRVITRQYTLTDHPSYPEIVRSLIFVFTSEVGAAYIHNPMKTTATHREELTNHFFSLLHKSFFTHRDTAFYADQLCITTKHLSRVIQQVTGHTPSYWIADFTVREAKTRLKSTTLTITELSEKLNFPNSSFFARYFKRHTGVSPQEYRLPVLADTVSN